VAYDDDSFAHTSFKGNSFLKQIGNSSTNQLKRSMNVAATSMCQRFYHKNTADHRYHLDLCGVRVGGIIQGVG
jgi:hypothetical protein